MSDFPDSTEAEASSLTEETALVFDVSEEDAGARLDAFLAARVEGVSRTTLKRAIEEGDVLVGGRESKPSYKLRAGERVEAELPEPPAAEVEPEDIPLEIVHEDDEVIVVNKPTGLVVHPAAGVRTGTLANALAFRFRNSELGNQQSIRPGIVHRLDRDTSGLIVVAKTARAHESLSDQFRARTVFKSYAALVHGATKEDKGKIEQPIARDPRHRTRMGVVRGGRAALTLWRVRRRYERFTLLDVEIKTGRTHQIRVHLAWMKHPVVGDETYGMGRDKTIADPRLRAAIAAMGRQFLHAARLGFHHPRTGEWMSFGAPPPPDLARLLEELEAKR
ncbi:MAG TPA: RluA family pseudouridine synthase [Pyrinomonadaceae bacterium]|jgi:23S rRNA pseudouridine1911/1915/1917 synthase|nr:RluA family pseudouridine synthase [Pyrinomonadaceae bacterium]